MWGSKKSKEEIRYSTLDVSVEIFDTVIDRIRNVVSNSHIEEGGKFIGKITKKGNNLNIRVETYIDSGPRVDNSSGHLLPDGDYQEKMFRVLETFDPKIDFIGSWHTHHCNGLTELSSGDIQGYMETVNSPRYDIDYFFALLVTGLHSSKIDKRYYLFCRGQTDYYELDDSQVKGVHGSSPLEPILQSHEKVSLARRKQRSYSSSSYPQEIRGRTVQSSMDNDPLQKARREDNQWILKKFPSAKTLRNKETDSIYWRWSINLDQNQGILEVNYKHPVVYHSGTAYLEVWYHKQLILSEEIPMNSPRHGKIEQYLNEARDKIGIRNEDEQFHGATTLKDKEMVLTSGDG